MGLPGKRVIGALARRRNHSQSCVTAEASQCNTEYRFNSPSKVGVHTHPIARVREGVSSPPHGSSHIHTCMSRGLCQPTLPRQMGDAVFAIVSRILEHSTVQDPLEVCQCSTHALASGVSHIFSQCPSARARALSPRYKCECAFHFHGAECLLHHFMS